jgi:metal-dependent hydrolase (beta-lactamase superfamily II)
MGAGRVAARQFADGETVAGLRAEHGFSALVTVRSGNTSSTLRGVVLSHGHFDHAGGFHLSGWRAQHALAAMLPDAWVQSSVGTTYTLSAT